MAGGYQKRGFSGYSSGHSLRYVLVSIQIQTYSSEEHKDGILSTFLVIHMSKIGEGSDVQVTTQKKAIPNR